MKPITSLNPVILQEFVDEYGPTQELAASRLRIPRTTLAGLLNRPERLPKSPLTGLLIERINCIILHGESKRK